MNNDDNSNSNNDGVVQATSTNTTAAKKEMYNLFNSHSVGLFNCENTDKNRRGVRSYTVHVHH